MSKREKLIELMTAQFRELINDGDWTFAEMIQNVADYLLQNGVIVPPVKVGQKVYYILDEFIEPCAVKVIHLGDYTDKDGNWSCTAEIHFDREDCPYVTTEIYFTDIGKKVFLTKEAAEKALKGGASGDI